MSEETRNHRISHAFYDWVRHFGHPTSPSDLGIAHVQPDGIALDVTMTLTSERNKHNHSGLSDLATFNAKLTELGATPPELTDEQQKNFKPSGQMVEWLDNLIKAKNAGSFKSARFVFGNWQDGEKNFLGEENWLPYNITNEAQLVFEGVDLARVHGEFNARIERQLEDSVPFLAGLLRLQPGLQLSAGVNDVFPPDFDSDGYIEFCANTTPRLAQAAVDPLQKPLYLNDRIACIPGPQEGQTLIRLPLNNYGSIPARLLAESTEKRLQGLGWGDAAHIACSPDYSTPPALEVEISLLVENSQGKSKRNIASDQQKREFDAMAEKLQTLKGSDTDPMALSPVTYCDVRTKEVKDHDGKETGIVYKQMIVALNPGDVADTLDQILGKSRGRG